MAEMKRVKPGIHRLQGPKWRFAGYAAALTILILIAGLWFFRIPLFQGNFHTVIPNEVYRSGQLSQIALEHRIRELNLRSVINLRSSGSKSPWFKDEHEVTQSHGVDFYPIRMSAFMPPRPTLRHLVRVIDTAKRPFLLHCLKGVERSGFVSAAVLLLAGKNIPEARKQFGLAYGFVPLVCSPDLLKVLDDYEHWLTAQGKSHSPGRFRHWVEHSYVPHFYRARLEPLDWPTSIVRGKKVALRFRATNISPQPWRHSSRQDRGVHLGAKGRLLQPIVGEEFELRGGFHDLTIAPGDSVVLELEIPPFLEPGHYQFVVDLVDERVRWFSDMGSEPISLKLEIQSQ